MKGNDRPLNKTLIGLLLLASFLCPVNVTAEEQIHFKEVEIDAPFRDVLLHNPDFMKEGGARLFEGNDGRLVVIGVAKAFPEDHHAETINLARRKGEIRARTAILELGESIEISTFRGQEEHSSPVGRERTSLSSFFQVTETRIEGEIRQLPTIGTWWSQNQSTLYVAVGKVTDGEKQREYLVVKVVKANSRDKIHSFREMECKEPFISLLRNSPGLCTNGGVRGFLLPDNRNGLVAVGSAKIKGVGPKALNQASKVACLKAMRSLLENREGIQLSSVEYLADREHLKLCQNGEERISLSQFLSLQEERVSGLVKGLPIVAAWKNADGQVLYVAIGKLFDKMKN